MVKMAFGAFIDVPIIVVAFILTTFYRKQISHAIRKIKLPAILLSLLIAIPLIIFEEHINCGAYQCQPVIMPPTLPFLFIEVLILLVLVKISHTKRVFAPALLYFIFGVAWEFTVGVANKELYALNLFYQLFFIFYIGVSYAIIVILPLTILQVEDGK